MEEDAKQRCFPEIAMTLADPNNGSKRYWWIINKVLNKTKSL